jgi:lipopolysaccharide transport system ATP-binding protein
MSDVVIRVENLSKQYRLGEIGTGTISYDLNRWLAKVRGKEDPFSKVGQLNTASPKNIPDYVWALKDINFEVKQGEILGIIGRNGAGKSTLLKLLSKVTKPTTGHIKLKGRIAALLEVGTGFHPELTGRENIFLNGAILGMTKSEIKNKFDEIVDFSGVERYIDTPVKRYSSGMYVRLAFAVAAHLEQEILIVDEVLAVGDAEFQKKCLGKMQDVSLNDGRTVLFVSHNMAAINALCTKGLLLKNGLFEHYGLVDDCVKTYLNNNIEQTKISLSDRKDRIGNGVFQFVEVSLLNKDLKPQKEFLSGEELNIVIKYKNINNTTLNNVSIAIALNNSNDIQLTNMANYISNKMFETLPPDGKIICKIKKLPLVTGIYSFNFFSRVNDDISDWIINTCILNVESGDYYLTGQITESNQALFLMDYNFSVTQ